MRSTKKKPSRTYTCSCGKTHPDVNAFTRCNTSHRTIVSEPQPTWYLIDSASEIVATADDTETMFTLRRDLSHARPVHRLEHKGLIRGR